MSTGSVGSATNSVMGKDVFLKMLIAQLKNQDPLNPLSGADFAAQLAQFSSVEQLINVSSQLESLNTNIAAMANSQMSNLIGCEVTFEGNTVAADGTAKTLSYSLPEDVAKGTVSIYDEKGKLVKTIDFGSQQAGVNSVTWNPGSLTGTYTFQVNAQNKSGSTVKGTTLAKGTVSGITFKNGSSYLVVGGQEVAFSTVASVRRAG
ncbi:MAG: flagellar hook assembly protein FlgD [Syntrophobacterales bacterium]|nr:flagellar hook assembly protein FlgD [Syntrophobacterales bacterium]